MVPIPLHVRAIDKCVYRIRQGTEHFTSCCCSTAVAGECNIGKADDHDPNQNLNKSDHIGE